MQSFDVASLGQVFTPDEIVRVMLALRRYRGRTLEPSCGDGAFLRQMDEAVGLELDAGHCPAGALNIDFFAYPEHQRFDTIIGNPPYVRFQDIPSATRERLPLDLFDGRSNLYLFFIEKCIRHLAPGGELIFITPRDFLKATSAAGLNRRLFEAGSITDAIELGDARVFDGAVPNCLIWRFENGRTDRTMRYSRIGTGCDLAAGLRNLQWESRYFSECAGQLIFARGSYSVRLSDVAFVKVGAVSGADEVYADPEHGNRDFVCAATVRSGETRRMIWCEPGLPPPGALQPHRDRLLTRRIRAFDASNWWQWGRGYYQSDLPRVYVNGKTRAARPFFVHECKHYDGAVLAVFPHDPGIDLAAFCDALNTVDWAGLGFVCDGRFLFTQRSLETAPLPDRFAEYLPGSCIAREEGVLAPSGALV